MADAYVAQNRATTNFGKDKKLKVQTSPTLRSYLRFNVSGLSGTVKSATLRVHASTASTIPVDVRSVADNTWGETTITYNNAPAPSATVTASSSAFSSGQWVALDVTPLVSGNGLVSFALTTANTTVVQFDSREAATSVTPQLVIQTSNQIPPANTSPPMISGAAQAGQTLTASPGTWTGTQPITFAYQWQRCNSSGSSCSNIAGATGQSYVPVTADVGSTIRIVVTASNDLSSAASSAPTSVVAAAPVAPTNTSPPTVSGTAQDGQALTADPGSWSGTQPISYAYQWRRCDSAGANCADVIFATAQTYQVTSADVGSAIRVAVTATNSAGSSTASSAPTAVVVAAPVAPTNSSPPTVSGTAQDGQTLTADPGSWSGTQPLSYAYQWRRCDSGGANCNDIVSANAQTYVLTSIDVGSTIRVAVTATNSLGSNTAISAATAVVVAAAAATPPTNGSLPTVSGTAQDGQTLTADPGLWSGTQPISYAYQWRRCDSGGANCADVAGAIGQSYLVVSADVGSTLRVLVTASNSGGSGTASSAATAVVAAASAPPSNSSPPTISGTPTEGQILAANPGAWSGTAPITYTYQWRRCTLADADCGDIFGATGQTYKLTPDDAGFGIAVEITATNAFGSGTASSGVTAAVKAVSPSNNTPPSISGTAQKGQTLTANPGSWSGTAPISYAYQWQRCDSTGASCVSIAGATAQTYTLDLSDVGSTLRVAVTASNTAGTSSETSDSTLIVAGVYRSEVMADNPVSYWRLGEKTGATAADETGQNPGTYQNGVALGDPGALVGDTNAAPHFDGIDDQVSLGKNSSLNFGTSNFTVEAWIKMPTFSASLGETIIAKRSYTVPNAWQLSVSADTGFVGYVRAELRNSDGTSLKAYSNKRVDDNKWHYVVAGFDRTNGTTVYVDNFPKTTAGSTASWNVDNTTTTYIGHEARSDYPPFSGDIDEVAVYSYLLSATRIKVHYENGTAVSNTPPANTAAPTISGTAKNGYLLSAAAGTWTGVQPISYSYQWQRCDSTGSSCSNIQGATADSYTLGSADVGSTLRVAVTALNAGGSTLANSTATAVVADAALDPVIAAAGDIACRSDPVTSGTSCHYGLTSNLILSDSRITDVLALGDDQYDCGDYPFYLSYFGPTWGSIKAKFHPVPGNHEYLVYAPQNPDGSQPPGTLNTCDPSTTIPSAGYFDYWNGVGVTSGIAGDRDKGYYSYDVGSWHLIALNTECYAIDGCSKGSAEEKWLAGDLAAHSNKCTLAYWHEPLFSSGHVGNNTYVRDLWTDLYNAGADIVLNGHDHDYERFGPQTPAGDADSANGIREFVVGTGGRSHGGFDTIQPNSQVQNADTYGVLKLTLHAGSYDWQFVPESGKTFTDPGSASCH